MRIREDSWRYFILVFWLLVITPILFLDFIHWGYDDSYITFRYAYNLLKGQGFVYNAGERVLSTTTPLYALLLALLGHLWPDLPTLSNLISALSLGAGGFFLYHLGVRLREPWAGLVAALLLPLFPLMIVTFGAETCFYVMLILGALAFYATGWHSWAGVLAALATLTRADGALVALVLGCAYLFRHRRIPWKEGALFLILITPWYLFSWAYFGSPLPATLAAKQHQGQMVISESFARGFLWMLRNYSRYPPYWLHGGLALLGIGYAARYARRWFLLFAWDALYFGSYVFLGVTSYFWYYAPLVPAILAAVGLGVAAVRRVLEPILPGNWRNFAMLLMMLLLLWPQVEGLRHLRHHPDSRLAIYRLVGIWLDENTPPDASVGALEVGIIGYYSERRMIDFAGLLQPDVAQHLSDNYQNAAIWAIKRYRPDYIIMGHAWLPRLVEAQWFTKHYQLRQQFTDEAFSSPLLLYQRVNAG